MITAIFLAVVGFAVYRSFIYLEEWYASKSSDLSGVVNQPGFWMRILVPFGVAIAIFLIFKNKIKFK